MKTIIAAALVGLLAAHNPGDPMLGPVDSPSAAQAQALPAGSLDIPLTQFTLDANSRPQFPVDSRTLMVEPSAQGLTIKPELARDVAEGVAGLDEALRRMPGVVVSVAHSLDQHGLAALAYDDPAVKQKTNALGEALGRGLGGIARAMAKDMIGAAKGEAQ